MSTGVLLATGYNDYFVNPANGASAPTGLTTPSGPRGFYDPDAYPLVGTHTDTQPQDPATQVSGPGARLFTYSDDFHNTIHVRPIYVDVGSVVNPILRYVEVWNGYLRDTRTLDSLTVSNGEGITVSGVTLPYTFDPLEAVTFEVSVGTEGPAVIGARYDLVFTTLEGQPFWEVRGRRVLEWAEPPNWSQGVEETLAYKTEVITAFDGSEQRIALRHRPRRTLSFVPLADGDRDRDLRRWLATWQHRFFVMADWPRGVRSGGVPEGGQTLVLDAPMPEVAVGSLVSLRHGEQYQAIEVAAIEGLTLTLASPVTLAFPVGTKVYPTMTVHAGRELTSRRHTDNVGALSLSFLQAHLAGKVATAAAATTWRGVEVFLRPPNWRDRIDHQHRYPFDMLDAGRGVFEYRLPQDAPKDVRRASYLCADRDEVRDLEAFFRRCRGRRGEFFAPTWDRDLVLPSDGVLLSGSAQLPLADAEEVGRPDLDRVYRNLYVRLTDGTTLYRQVESGINGPNGPYLVLDTGWPRTIEAHEVRAMHWMPRWRLASDELTLTWRTDGLAEVTLAMQTLKDV